MYKKNNILFILLFLLENQYTIGQNFTNTHSPYSYYGLGIVENKENAQNLGVGGVKYTALNQLNQLNYVNPATISLVNTTVFSAGLSMNFIKISNKTTSQKNVEAYMKYINMGFKLAKRLNFGFGIIPYTKVGYDIVTSDTSSEDGIINKKYQGNGGINSTFIQFSYLLLKDIIQTLSIGVKPIYYFGSINRYSNVIPNSKNIYRAIYQDQISISGLSYEIGFLYQKKLKSNKDNKKIISVGASYKAGRNVLSKRLRLSYSQNGLGITIDTVSNINLEGKIKIPTTFGGGIAYSISNDKIAELSFGLDVSTIKWNEYEEFGIRSNFYNHNQISFGIQYLPSNSSYKGIIQAVKYRMGLKYSNLHFNIREQRINQYSMTLGVGIPLIKSGTINPLSSTVNFAAEIGSRGKKTENFIQESFFNYTFGVTFTPGKWDKWFKKKKIN